jgi:hypothetical protein
MATFKNSEFWNDSWTNQLTKSLKNVIINDYQLFDTFALRDSIQVGLTVFPRLNDTIVVHLKIYAEEYLVYHWEDYRVEGISEAIPDYWAGTDEFQDIIGDIIGAFIEWNIVEKGREYGDEDLDADIDMTLLNTP